MKRKIGEFLPEELLGMLSNYEKNVIQLVVSRELPVFFSGGPKSGKTWLARELRKVGLIAYAPEDISIIELGTGKNRITLNDKGYPVLLKIPQGEPNANPT